MLNTIKFQNVINYLVILIILILFNVNNFIFSQEEELNCLVTSQPGNPSTLGYILPSIGTVKPLPEGKE